MNYWLIKSEPDVWSLTQQKEAGWILSKKKTQEVIDILNK